MNYLHAKRNQLYRGFLVLGAVIIGTMVGMQPTKEPKKKAVRSMQIPPVPKPPIPISIDNAKIHQENALTGLTATTLLASVELFIESQSVELLVEQLKGITPQAAYDFMTQLIKRPRAMDADEVIQVAFGLLSYFMQDKEQREYAYRILDLVHTAPQLQEHPPLLVIAAHSNYPYVIPLIVHWAKSRNILATSIKDALTFIAHDFDTSMLKRFEQYGIALTPERATYIMWQAAQVAPAMLGEDNQDRVTRAEAKKLFIDFLITKKADVNYHNNDYTMLMQATKYNDVATIEQLLHNGAEVDRIVNDAIGSALQLAIHNDFVDAELILRHFNARE